MWCDNSTLNVVAGVRAIFWPPPPPPPSPLARTAVGSCTWRGQQKSASVGFDIAVVHCRDALRLVTAGILCNWALQGYLELGTAGMLCGWALRLGSGLWARTT